MSQSSTHSTSSSSFPNFKEKIQEALTLYNTRHDAPVRQSYDLFKSLYSMAKASNLSSNASDRITPRDYMELLKRMAHVERHIGKFHEAKTHLQEALILKYSAALQIALAKIYLHEQNFIHAENELMQAKKNLKAGSLQMDTVQELLALVRRYKDNPSSWRVSEFDSQHPKAKDESAVVSHRIAANRHEDGGIRGHSSPSMTYQSRSQSPPFAYPQPMESSGFIMDHERELTDDFLEDDEDSMNDAHSVGSLEIDDDVDELEMLVREDSMNRFTIHFQIDRREYIINAGTADQELIRFVRQLVKKMQFPDEVVRSGQFQLSVLHRNQIVPLFMPLSIFREARFSNLKVMLTFFGTEETVKQIFRLKWNSF